MLTSGLTKMLGISNKKFWNYVYFFTKGKENIDDYEQNT